MKKIIEYGEALPRYYGLAYPLLDRRAWVIYPILLNHLMRLLRTIYLNIEKTEISELEKKLFQREQKVNAREVAVQRAEAKIEAYSEILTFLKKE